MNIQTVLFHLLEPESGKLFSRYNVKCLMQTYKALHTWCNLEVCSLSKCLSPIQLALLLQNVAMKGHIHITIRGRKQAGVLLHQLKRADCSELKKLHVTIYLGWDITLLLVGLEKHSSRVVVRLFDPATQSGLSRTAYPSEYSYAFSILQDTSM